MVFAWGFRDWNRINAAHIYAETKSENARKLRGFEVEKPLCLRFYQIHAMLLTYLSQDSKRPS